MALSRRDVLVALGSAWGVGSPWQRVAARRQARQEPIIGLLDLPEVIGQPCGLANARTADVYDQPSTGSRPIGTLRYDAAGRTPDGGACTDVRLRLRLRNGSEEDAVVQERGYEEQALVVFERAQDWYRVARVDGSMWIHRADPSDFASYEQLLTDRLTYLRPGWDGALWPAAGSGRSITVPSMWRPAGEEIPMELIAHRRVRGGLWLHVTLRSENCGQVLAPPPEPSGWLPGYRASAETTAWFWSRGC